MERKSAKKLRLESQDDVAYLTGQRSSAEREKQIKTPAPRRSRRIPADSETSDS